MKRRSILFVLDQFPGFGGIESVTATLARGLSCVGLRVGILAWQSESGTDQMHRLGQGVRVWQLRRDSSIDDVLSEFKPEVVIFQDDYAPIENRIFNVIGKMRAGARPKVITVEHNRPSLRLGNVSGQGLIKWMRLIKRPFLTCFVFFKFAFRRRYLYSNSDVYCLLSKRYVSLAWKLKFFGGMSKFWSIPNPLTRAPLSQQDKVKQVLFVGTLNKRKGVGHLLRVWSEIERDVRFAQWRMCIVGDGPDSDEYLLLAKSLSLQRVKFSGKKSDPSSDYAISSIFLMASEYEGWPMVLGEAMSNGCVPICTNSFEAVYDIIDDGINGLVVDHINVSKYVDSLKLLMESSSLLQRMAIAAREKASQFTVDKIIAQWGLLLNMEGEK